MFRSCILISYFYQQSRLVIKNPTEAIMHTTSASTIGHLPLTDSRTLDQAWSWCDWRCSSQQAMRTREVAAWTQGVRFFLFWREGLVFLIPWRLEGDRQSDTPAVRTRKNSRLYFIEIIADYTATKMIYRNTSFFSKDGSKSNLFLQIDPDYCSSWPAHTNNTIFRRRLTASPASKNIVLFLEAGDTVIRP